VLAAPVPLLGAVNRRSYENERRLGRDFARAGATYSRHIGWQTKRGTVKRAAGRSSFCRSRRQDRELEEENMAWSIEGTYFENCSCDSVCPCTTSEFTQPADTERCQAVLAFHIERGTIEGADVSGLTAVMVVDSPALMSEGNWKFGLIIDRTATNDQAAKLEAVMDGRLGGVPAAVAGLVGERFGTERAAIDYVDDGQHHRVRIGDRTSIEIEDFVSPETNEVVKITGVSFPSRALTVARATESRIKLLGLEWSFEGKNAHSAPFAWAA
jgi:hypothetical protein